MRGRKSERQRGRARGCWNTHEGDINGRREPQIDIKTERKREREREREK